MRERKEPGLPRESQCDVANQGYGRQAPGNGQAFRVRRHAGFVGVSDHGGWAVLVTATFDGTLLDRRRVELIDDILPALPHHHEGPMLPVADAIALVEQVRMSADRYAATALDSVAMDVTQLHGIALRACQPLPDTIAERLADYRARNVADWVMYRRALASAAETRRLRVHWFDPRTVLDDASRAIGSDFLAMFTAMRKAVGPPWNSDHKLAMAAAIVAANEGR